LGSGGEKQHLAVKKISMLRNAIFQALSAASNEDDCLLGWRRNIPEDSHLHVTKFYMASDLMDSSELPTENGHEICNSVCEKSFHRSGSLKIISREFLPACLYAHFA
jgi:hypothetical protein